MNLKDKWSGFITNKGKYSKYDPDYSKAYLLNISLIVMSLAFFVYGIINLVATVTPVIPILNFILMIATIATLIYFHATNNLNICTILSVILLTVFLSSFIYIVGNNFYGLFWFATYPPYVYFLLGRKRGHIATFLYSATIFVYILISSRQWEPALFSVHSFLNIFGTIICLALMVMYYEKSKEYAYESLMMKNMELEVISVTDRLTGLYNRYMIDEVLYQSLKKSKDCEKPFSIIIADIDFFKTINDNFGHLVGDKVLVEIADIFKSAISGTDIVGRWGGEEFMIICPEKNIIEANKLAVYIKDKIAKKDFGIVGKITMSFGAAACSKGETIDSLIRKADNSLFKAKKQGRNKINSYQI